MLFTNEVDNLLYLQNSMHRCFYCKHELYSGLRRFADERNIRFIIDGTNVDDGADFRPGTQAAQELKVRSPFRDSCLE
jgi:uncharacterized protein